MRVFWAIGNQRAINIAFCSIKRYQLVKNIAENSRKKSWCYILTKVGEKNQKDKDFTFIDKDDIQVDLNNLVMPGRLEYVWLMFFENFQLGAKVLRIIWFKVSFIWSVLELNE